MNKLLLVLSFTILAVGTANAQNDMKKAEFFAGYSHGQVDGSQGQFVRTADEIGQTGPHRFHGATAAGVYNLSRYFGLRGDVSATFRGGDLNIPVNATTTITGNARNSLYNVLGGVQVKDNATEGRLKPFAYALGGVAFARTRVEAACQPAANCASVIVPVSNSDTAPAAAFGAGLDVRVNDRFDIRVGQIDYNPVFLDRTLHNVRIGVGIVIK